MTKEMRGAHRITQQSGSEKHTLCLKKIFRIWGATERSQRVGGFYMTHNETLSNLCVCVCVIHLKSHKRTTLIETKADI